MRYVYLMLQIILKWQTLFPLLRGFLPGWTCLCLLGSFAYAQESTGWVSVVRATPYWESQGVADNLTTIRRWVLFSDSYCTEQDRHLLLDRRWRFVGYIDDEQNALATNQKLNATRENLVGEGRIDTWHAGSSNVSGYPFALACHQPYVDMQDTIGRLTGSKAEYLLWGTWDGMSIGTEAEQVSLVELFHAVVDFRREQGRFSFPDTVIPTLLGKLIIESGAQKNAFSSEAARGIMQLLPQVLDDCRTPDEFRLHRIAQIDCALQLVEQNHRNLAPVFVEVFGHLPQQKQDTLYGLMLSQAYLIGVGRSIELLQDEELGQAARYFARHQENFTAEDILVGMIYHNLGRKDIGLLTLYYVTDARLSQQALCDAPPMRDDKWCAVN